MRERAERREQAPLRVRAVKESGNREIERERESSGRANANVKAISQKPVGGAAQKQCQETDAAATAGEGGVECRVVRERESRGEVVKVKIVKQGKRKRRRK